MGIRPLPLVIATLLIITTFPYAASTEAPLADAGLDQTVTKGATVQLDATGSRDPDGSIEAFQWEILAPDGQSLTPECATCGQTTSTAVEVGTYEVIITVTDDDGHTANDTLYVEVEPGEPPSLVLTGPSKLQTGQTGTYVAEAESGDADLEKIVWLVDGSVVDSQPVSGDTASASLDQQFPTASTHHITARAVDADDQTAIQTVTTSVVSPPSNPGNQQSPRPGGGTTGNRGTVSIAGPQVLTGAVPLRGTYTLSGTHVDSVTWWQDGMKVGTGPEYTTAFAPGDHRLHATVTYTDGSTDIGRFNDGTTKVVADPQPTLDVTGLSGTGGLTIDALASDEYGNLRGFEVYALGEPVLSKQSDRFKIQKDDHGRTLELSAETLEMDPGQYELEVVATDARGQRTSEYHQVEVVGPPEVIRSEFEEKEDIDVYHPRIDPERYTVKHVLEIELNGVNWEDITVSNFASKGLKSISNSECSPNTVQQNYAIIFTSCWSPIANNMSDLRTEVKWDVDTSYSYSDYGVIQATPSDPELDIRVISGGAGANAKRWGLWIDASRSFDPDGTRLDYHWSGGAVPANSRGDIGKLDSFHKAGLMIEDENGGRSTFSEFFLRHFNPKIRDVSQVSNGPYLPSDDIVFVVESEPYELPKNRYRDELDITLEPSVGEVVDRTDYHGEFAGDVHDWYDPVANESAGRFDQIFWTVRVPAEAFRIGDPGFETFHAGNYEETVEGFRFPEPEVLEPGTPYVENPEIETEYLVRKPLYSMKSTVYPDLLEAYEEDGYQVIRSEATGRQWTFERRELVSPAQYESESMSFGSSGERSIFLELNPEWEADGSKLITNEVTRTRTEWRNSKQGAGKFTGAIRQQKVQSAEYLVEREYRYTYTSTETRTRTRTKTYQYETTVQYEETIEECNSYVGCYERTVTRTKSVTQTATREYVQTYNVEVTRTATYWASGKRDGSHEYTGASRRTLIQPAEYRTQYEFEYTETLTTQNREYLASNTRLVEPAKYEWLHYQTTRSQLYAQELAAAEGIRQRDSKPILEWTLRKQTGSELRTYSDYSNEDDVEETRVEISGTIVRPYKDPNTGAIVTKRENHSTLNYTTTAVPNRDAIIERFITEYMEDKI